MLKHQMFELSFSNLPEGGELAAESKKLPGFYAGNGAYKARSLPKAAPTASSASMIPARLPGKP